MTSGILPKIHVLACLLLTNWAHHAYSQVIICTDWKMSNIKQHKNKLTGSKTSRNFCTKKTNTNKSVTMTTSCQQQQPTIIQDHQWASITSEDKYQLLLINPLTESCCRQNLTITVINYSGRVSELGGTVNTVDWQRSSLSRSEHPPLSSWADNMFRRWTYLLWQNFQSQEFKTKFQRWVSLFL